MAQPINRVPPGLLSLLDIKSLGQNPVVLGDELRATLELNELYIASVARTLNSATGVLSTVGAKSPTVKFEPAAGEIWVIEKAAAITAAVIGAGAAYAFRLCIYDSTNGITLWTSDAIGRGGTGEQPTVGARNLIIGPGQGLGVFIESVTVGGSVFQVSAQVAALRF